MKVKVRKKPVRGAERAEDTKRVIGEALNLCENLIPFLEPFYEADPQFEKLKKRIEKLRVSRSRRDV